MAKQIVVAVDATIHEFPGGMARNSGIGKATTLPAAIRRSMENLLENVREKAGRKRFTTIQATFIITREEQS